MRVLVLSTALLAALSAFAACSTFSASTDAPDGGDEGGIDGASDASNEAAIPVDGGLAAAYGAAVLSDKPFVYWRMDGVDAGFVEDTSEGGANPLALTGMFTIASGVTGEPTDHAIDFGTSGSGSAVFTKLAALDAAFTFECWVQTTSTQALSTIFARYEPSPTGTDREGVLAYLYNGGATAERDNGDAASFLHGPTLTDGSFHHVTVTRDYPSTVQNFIMYVDAVVSQATESDFVQFVAGTTPISIGTPTPSFNFVGSIDEVAIYDHALTQARIAAHYYAARPRSRSIPNRARPAAALPASA